jgi:protein-tyrosine phosphatase
MYKILFVRTGNICRSPTAEGVLRSYIQQHSLDETIFVDSAGTHGYHVGEKPDSRSCLMAQKHGVNIDDQRSRKFIANDFYDFDLILALDHGHHRDILNMAPKDAHAEIALFLPFAGMKEEEVPDPYYGNEKDFMYVFELIDNAAKSLVKNLKIRTF